MKYCIKCGYEIEEGVMFSPESGTKVVVPFVNNTNNLGIAKSTSMSIGDLLTYIRMVAGKKSEKYKEIKKVDDI